MCALADWLEDRGRVCLLPKLIVAPNVKKRRGPAMFCVYCRADNPSNAYFCRGCGKRLQREAASPIILCLYCKEDNPQDAIFCRNCGEQLKEGESVPTSDMTVPGWVLAGRVIGEGQALAGHVPMVQGTPQVGDVPMVQGTPSAPGSPVSGQAGSSSAGQGFAHSPTPPSPTSGYSSAQAGTSSAGQGFAHGGTPPSPTSGYGSAQAGTSSAGQGFAHVSTPPSPTSGYGSAQRRFPPASPPQQPLELDMQSLSSTGTLPHPPGVPITRRRRLVSRWHRPGGYSRRTVLVGLTAVAAVLAGGGLVMVGIGPRPAAPRCAAQTPNR